MLLTIIGVSLSEPHHINGTCVREIYYYNGICMVRLSHTVYTRVLIEWQYGCKILLVCPTWAMACCISCARYKKFNSIVLYIVLIAKQRKRKVTKSCYRVGDPGEGGQAKADSECTMA